MKTFVILFTLFYFLNALAVAPYGFKGQEQSQTLYSNVLQAPNNLVTNLGGINALMETGNNNLLVNPSFEHLTFSTGWTNSAGTFTEETALEIHGKKAAKLVLSSQTMSLTQSSTLYASQFADGVQGLASVRVKSNIALKVCSIQAGVVSTSLCVDVQTNNKWGLYKVPFILGATSNGISIASTGAVSGTVYIDDAFVGAVDLKVDIDASKIAGESYFAGTASCIWNRASATVGAFTASATCPGPTIVTSTMGQWQTTDSDLPRVTINNLPAGTYKAKFIVREFMNTAATNNPVLAINDGTTTCEPIAVNESTTTAVSQTAECTFVYTSSGNRVFELYGAAPANTITVANTATAPRASTKFILEYFGSSSVYSSTNADTDWASCGHTAASFTGLGSVTNISTQCKRQGADLLMKGSFTVGTVTAVEARLSLPLWNGVQLTSAGSSIIPSLQLSGDMIYSASSTVNFRHATLIEPSVSYMTFAYQSSTNAAFQKILGTVMSANNQNFSFSSRIPIQGWQQSNIIIGQFNGLESCTSTLECTDTFSAKISSAGVVSDENVNWINGSCSVSGTSIYACTFNTSIFTVAPNCVVNPVVAGHLNFGSIDNVTSTIATYRINNYTGIAQARDAMIVCQKQGVDYIGKTAKAVASDQNLRTPGVTNAVLMSAKVDGSAVVTNQKGNFISSCTGTTTRTCTFTSSFLSEPNCLVNCNLNAAGCISARITTQSSSSVSFETYSTAAVTANPVILSCHGERQ